MIFWYNKMLTTNKKKTKLFLNPTTWMDLKITAEWNHAKECIQIAYLYKILESEKVLIAWESRSVTALGSGELSGGFRGVKWWLRGMRSLLRGWVCSLSCLWWWLHGGIHKSKCKLVHFKYVDFMLCQLYLKKAIFKL